MGALIRFIRRLIPLIATARKRRDGVRPYKVAIRLALLRWVGIYIDPVIEEPEVSDDPTVVDSIISGVMAKNRETRGSLPIISAVFRIKNASAFLYLSVSSFIPLCREIVIVDNGSTDTSLDIARRLQKDFSGICHIGIFEYEASLATPGDGYSDAVRRAPEKSIASYYNFAFSKATGEYLVKADAHTILMPFGVSEIQAAILQGADVVHNSGVEVFGRQISVEPRIYRRSASGGYLDGERWEYLTLRSESVTHCFLSRPVFLHIKALLFARTTDQGLSFNSRDLYSRSLNRP